jgi:adenine-specific DNA-methyltransferase
MRYMGNKTKLVDFLYESLKNLPTSDDKKFFDFFAGTASVGKSFKEKGYSVESADILYFSYVLQKAYIDNTGEPEFKFFATDGTGYNKALTYLDNLPSLEGYVYTNFTADGTVSLDRPRLFFTSENGKKIDAIRLEIENLKNNGHINENEYFVLLASLLETVSFYANVSGVYAAFLKTYDPRALKPFILRKINFTNLGVNGKSFHANSVDLLDTIDTDILYLDPPYNARQYAPNYHVLETLARYDNPVAKGVAGIRDYTDLKSDFCNHDKALIMLDKIAQSKGYKHLALSYNSEGIMKENEILSVLEKYGDVVLLNKDYRRFKSNNNGLSATKKEVIEQLYILTK